MTRLLAVLSVPWAVAQFLDSAIAALRGRTQTQLVDDLGDVSGFVHCGATTNG
jgi:hypothetical protein